MPGEQFDNWRARPSPDAQELTIEGYAIILELLDYIYQLQALHGAIIAPDTATVLSQIRQRILNETIIP